MTRSRSIAVVLLCVASVGAACQKPNTYGPDGSKAPSQPGGKTAIRDEKPTTTVLTPSPTAPPAVQVTARTPPPTPKPTTTTTAKPVPVTHIGLYGDESGHQAIEPSQTQAKRGGIIRFTNHDPAVARSVESDKGRFQSPLIPPGGSWELKVTLPPGTYGYNDGTRPYATALFQVVG